MISLRAQLTEVLGDMPTLSFKAAADALGLTGDISIRELSESTAPGGGSSGQPSGSVLTLVEPAPDHETGGGPGNPNGTAPLALGDKLKMERSELLLYLATSVHEHEPVQGFLGNCPLAAVLCAMAHIPNERLRIQDEIIEEVVGQFETHRIRKDWEYSPGQAPNPLPRLPTTGFFEGNRFFIVHFLRNFPGFDFQGGKSSIQVTPVIHMDKRPPPNIHYMRSTSGVLWPSVVEKAYAVAHGENAYESLVSGIAISAVMRDLTGSAREDLIQASTENPGEPLVPSGDLENLLSDHKIKATVLGSIGPPFQPNDPPHPRIIANHTFAVIGWDGTNATVIDPAEDNVTNREIGNLTLVDIRDNFGEIVQGKLN